MVKVFIFNGSLNRNSTTDYLIKNFLNKLKQNSDIELSTYYLKNKEISNCIGCSRCFQNKECVLDDKDCFDKVRAEMLDSDIIIIGTPIYANNVTGYCKTFIDRISSWCHIFKLIGKREVIITTTSNSGLDEVNNYLYKVMSYLGLADIEVISHQLNKDNINRTLDEIDYISSKLINNIKNNEKLKFSKLSEESFERLKEFYLSENANINEKKYWEETGMITCESLDKIIYERR